MNKKTCIVICGPTASGKTATAIAVAKHFNTSIISADSRQCFSELNIGVARPSAEELAAVPHHFIATHSIHNELSAAGFEQYALSTIADLFKEKDVVVMAGGTGLYIQAFCEGMDAIPAATAALRNAITAQYQQQGLAWLQQQVQAEDPAYYAAGEVHNPRRLMRALEVIRSTGQSITTLQQSQKKQRPFAIVKAGLELPRELLYQRINSRVLQMLEAGLEAEARALYPYRHLNALQTVGYRELFDYFEGKTGFERAVELIQQNTRHYAKRQLTWFKKDADIQWLPADAAAADAIVKLAAGG